MHSLSLIGPVVFALIVFGSAIITARIMTGSWLPGAPVLHAVDSDLLPYWYGQEISSAPIYPRADADALSYGVDYIIGSETRLSVLRASSAVLPTL